MDFIEAVLFLCISTLINIVIIKYIISRMCFIQPMKNKYAILIDIKTDKTRAIITKAIVGIVLICFLVYPLFLILYLYHNSKILLILSLTIALLFFLYFWNKYRKYEIFEYINYYSTDLLDWDKIYELEINDNIKRKCFEIHNINYDTYKDTYLKNLEIKKKVLDIKTEELNNKIEKHLQK